jgi:hypothetical protein
MRIRREGSSLASMNQSDSGDTGETLATPPYPDHPVSFVVHPHRVVAEDLREILQGVGLQDVRIAGRLCDVPITGVALAIIAAGEEELSVMPHIPAWAGQAVPVIVLDTNPDMHAGGETLAHLSQPFEPAGVVLILRRLGVI